MYNDIQTRKRIDIILQISKILKIDPKEYLEELIKANDIFFLTKMQKNTCNFI